MAERQSGKKLSPVERRRSFAEIKSGLLPHQALSEASRCLFCNEAPCSIKCPAGVDVVNFIRKIKTKNYLGSIRLIRDKNPFASTCSRICPQAELCESGCNSSSIGQPVAIGELQRFVSDLSKNIAYPKAELTGKSVLVIGAGPAGLACAYNLRRNGLRVTIIEKKKLPGGGLTHYIPDYRLPKEIVNAEISAILSMGDIEILYGTEINDMTPYYNQFDAVFAGLGLIRNRALGIPGEDNAGVFFAEDIIEKSVLENSNVASCRMKEQFEGKKVSVIGGGNVAMDIASTIVRYGGDVNIVYRRTANELPAWKKEYDEAVEDGVKFRFLSAPVEILGSGNVERIRLRMMKLTELDSSGRAHPVEVPGSDFEIDADFAVYALGRLRDYSFIEQYVTGNLSLPFELNRETGNIYGTKIYIGGDLLNDSGTAVAAIGDGMRASSAIIKALS